MINKMIALISIILLTINLQAQTNGKNDYRALADQIIYVDDDNVYGPWDGTISHPYKTIKDGVNKSTENNTIYIFNGTYHENITINKKIKIFGENRTNTIIDGLYTSKIISITANNTIISNLTISNSGGYKNNAGIKVSSTDSLIENCIFYKTKSGIYLEKTNKITIDNCTFYKNAEGIKILSSKYTHISGCYFAHNSFAINIDNSDETIIDFCYIQSSSIAILCNGSSNTKITYCNISDNSVNLGGIFIKNSVNIIINDNIIKHNGAGICLYSSEDINISKNDLIFNTHFAVSMRTPSKNVSIIKCNISDNFRYGFYIEERNTCQIENNNIMNNFLYSIYSKRSYCDARKNYWGNILGPSFTDVRSGYRIKRVFGRLKYMPWLMESIDNIGVDWKENKSYLNKKINYPEVKQINLTGSDTDQDGLPDWWETKWGYDPLVWDDHIKLDPDNDSLNNFEECYTDYYDSNPFIKDIFIEIDWMETKDTSKSNKPESEYFEKAISNFKKNNINLHIDIDEEIPFCESDHSFEKLRDFYWDYFLHNNLDNPRKGIFRYCTICNYCPDLNFPFIGWDNLDFFAISSEWLKEKKPFTSKRNLVTGAIIHHLGHTLDLLSDTYNGIDNSGTINLFSIQWFKYKNYKSSMNYFYKYNIFTYSDGTHGRGDFNDWDNLDFSFFKNSDFCLKK